MTSKCLHQIQVTSSICLSLSVLPVPVLTAGAVQSINTLKARRNTLKKAGHDDDRFTLAPLGALPPAVPPDTSTPKAASYMHQPATSTARAYYKPHAQSSRLALRKAASAACASASQAAEGGAAEADLRPRLALIDEARALRDASGDAPAAPAAVAAAAAAAASESLGARNWQTRLCVAQCFRWQAALQ